MSNVVGLHKKLLTAILVLLCIIVLGGALTYQHIRSSSGAFCSAKEQCKTFNSNKYNLSFKYPSNLTVGASYDEELQRTAAYKITSYIVVGPSVNLKDPHYKGPDAWPDLIISTLPSDYVKEPDYEIPDPSFQKLSNSQKVVDKLKLNGRTYSLIRYQSSSTELTGSYIRLAQCRADKECATAIKRADGSYISAEIGIEGEMIPPLPTLDSTNSDYVTLVNVLKSLTF